MKLSINGLNLLKSFEGFRSVPYRDVAGFMTVGYGHRILAGEDFSAGITEEQGRVLLGKDAAFAEAQIALLAPQCNQNQFDALTDFCFNLGGGSLKKLLSHGWDEVPTQLMHWTLAGGVEQPGLVKRRTAEESLFNSEVE